MSSQADGVPGLLEIDQHRCLAFIDSCTRSGYAPTVEEIELWIDSPSRRGPMILSKFMSQQLASFSKVAAAIQSTEDCEPRRASVG